MLQIIFGGIYTQIFILGMHHTGTSIVANMTMQLGIFGGYSEEFLYHSTNPLKFWERLDVIELGKQRLKNGSGCANSSMQETNPKWAGFAFRPECGTSVQRSAKASEILKYMDTHKPWVIKEPRMALFAPEWLAMVNNPKCIVVRRDRMETIESLMKFSSHVDLFQWGQLYDTYYDSIQDACQHHPTMELDHRELLQMPYESFLKVQTWLRAQNMLASDASSKTMEGARTTVALIQRQNESLRQSDWNWKHLPSEIQYAFMETDLPDKSFAFATLLTTNDLDYLKGALVLGTSIRNFYAMTDMICLVTEAVPSHWHLTLVKVGWKVKLVKEIPEYRWNSCRSYTQDQKNRWGHMMTKLRIWELPYDRVVYMDTDSAMIQPIPTEIFEHEFVAEKGTRHQYFNAGIMIVTPNVSLQNMMIEHARNHRPQHIFGNSIDCTEQGLLVEFFYTVYSHKSVYKVIIGHGSSSFHNITDLKETFAIHWITHQCPKPWDTLQEGAFSFLDIWPSPALHDCDLNSYYFWMRLWQRVKYHYSVVEMIAHDWRYQLAYPRSVMHRSEYERGRRLSFDAEYEQELLSSFLPRWSTFELFLFTTCFVTLLLILRSLYAIMAQIAILHSLRKDGFEEIGREHQKKVVCAQDSDSD